MPPKLLPSSRSAVFLAVFGAVSALLCTIAMVLLLPGLGASGHEHGAGAPPVSAGSAQAVSQTRDDGAIELGEEISVFDETHPALVRLDPELLAAVRAAASDAQAEGLETFISSGWRSPEYQRFLLEDAIREYGSAAEASRWVAPPETSSHVSGDAVDLGPTPFMYWVQQHGARYGLCQTYGNEVWHYELRQEAPATGCPEPYADPTEDPRLAG